MRATTDRWAQRSPRRKNGRHSWLRRSLSSDTRLPQFTISETLNQVIVHHSHGLHEGITDRAAHKFETTVFQVLAHVIRFGGFCRNLLDRFPGVLLRLVIHETPNILVKRAELSLHCQEHSRILDGSLDLQPVANDPRIRQQALSLFLAIFGNDGRIEFVKGYPVVLALLQNCFPTQTRLRSFEDQELEQKPVVVDWHAPLVIVILNVQIALRPPAAAHFSPSRCFQSQPPDQLLAQWGQGFFFGQAILRRNDHRSLLHQSNALQLGDRPLVTHIARIQRRGWLEKQDVRHLLSDRPMFDATRNDQEFAFFEPDMPILKLHAEAAFDNEDQFVLVVVVVQYERPLEFDQLHHLAIQLADDLRLPLVAELRQLLFQVHLVHDWLRVPGASRSQYHE